jgi:L-iditol 2-dehydrogenase
MRAAALVAPGQIRILDVPSPALGPHDVRIRPDAVGVCGTDFHIYSGESNFNLDATGRPIALDAAPQILGHEIAGTVLECGDQVRDLAAGDRVVVDQGRNCHSERRASTCEYCESGDSHQCEHYTEHGITGLPGGFAEQLVVPARNAIKIESSLSLLQAAMTEPLACVLHSTDFGERANTRYRFGGNDRRVRTAVVVGAGPAGLLFVQVLRNVLGFDGPLVVSDPSPHKRALAASFGATAVAPHDLEAAVLDASQGRRAEYLVEATGSGPVFEQLPRLIRKQATTLLYGVGHGGASLELLNPMQWREAILITSVGASGGFDGDLRPAVYRRALRKLERGQIQVAPLLTHTYRGLQDVPRAFGADSRDPAYVKGVAVLD